MPSIYKSFHNDILQSKVTKPIQYFQEKDDKSVFGIQNNGYIIPLFVEIRKIITLSDETILAAIFKYEKKDISNPDVGFLLFDLSTLLIGMSSSFIHLFLFSLPFRLCFSA
jgi:hypothetical protein